MRVKNNELSTALYRSPTPHWSGVLHSVREEIKEATICHYAGIRIVEDSAWARAMDRIRQLPAGGRHVAKAYSNMWLWINRATDFTEGESKCTK
jgi:hypothetical protein